MSINGSKAHSHLFLELNWRCKKGWVHVGWVQEGLSVYVEWMLECYTWRNAICGLYVDYMWTIYEGMLYVEDAICGEWMLECYMWKNAICRLNAIRAKCMQIELFRSGVIRRIQSNFAARTQQKPELGWCDLKVGAKLCWTGRPSCVVLPPYVSYPFHAWSWRRNITVPGIRVAPFKRFLLPVQLFLLNVLCVRV